jgi:hypothetical protein
MPCCYICDKQVDEPKLDPRDMKTTPCSECEAIIQECLDSFEEQEVEQIDQEDKNDTNDYEFLYQLCETDLDDA